METEQDVDLDIVATSYRLISDGSAFDDLFRVIDRKLSGRHFGQNRGQNPGQNPGQNRDKPFSPALLRQLKKARDLFDRETDQPVFGVVERVLSDVSGAAAVFLPDGTVMALNESAADQWGLRQGARTEFDWVLPESRSDLSGLRAACVQPRNSRHSILRIGQGTGSEFAEAFVLSDTNHDQPSFAIRSLALPWSEQAGAMLSEAFGLTAAEVEICRLLFRTCDIARVASRRGTSIRTVTTQLSSVFQKTGLPDQVSLIRLVAMLCARADPRKTSRIPVWTDPFGRETLFHDRHGRQISFSWLGDPHGRPVLLLHGLTLGYAVTPETDRYLARTGLRVIVPCRPGQGNTLPRPGENAVDGAMALVTALIAHLKLPRVVLAGLGAATVPLLELAARKAAPVCGVYSIGGFPTLVHRRNWSSLPVTHRTFFALRTHAPWVTEMIAKAGLRSMKQHGVDWYLRRAYAEAPDDLKLVENPQINALLRNACALTTAQGHRAFADDLDLFVHPARKALQALTIPFRLIHGENDMTVAPEDVRAVAGLNPKIAVRLIENAGELIFYSHIREIADDLSDFTATALAGGDRPDRNSMSTG